MKRSVPLRLVTGCAASFAVVCMLGVLAKPVYGAQDASTIEPEAAQILKQMSDYLGSLEQFRFRAANTIDTVARSGQQVQLSAQVDIAIQRPNRFRVNRKGEIVDQEFYFDGKTLTLYGKVVNYYANMNVSETVESNTALDLAKQEVGVILPASDLSIRTLTRNSWKMWSPGWWSAPVPSAGWKFTIWRFAAVRSTGRSGSRRGTSRCPKNI